MGVSEVRIEKRITKTNQVYCVIDTKTVTETEYYSKLSLLGIQRKSGFNFAMQNQIKTISSLTSAGLYDLLSQVIGTKGFNKSKETSMQILRQTNTEEEAAVKILEQYRAKLNGLNVDKQGFAQYEKQMKKVDR